MKKITIALIILVSLVFVSCNADNLGIFADVAASQPVAGIKISKYLGKFGDKNCILADDGLYIGTDLVYANNPTNGYIAFAAIDGDSGVKVIWNDGTSGKSGKINITGSSGVYTADSSEGTPGYCYLDLKGNYIEKPTDPKKSYSIILETDGQVLLASYNSEKKYDVTIQKSGAQQASFTMTKRPIGFQPLNSSNYVIMDDSNNFYKYTEGTALDETSGKIGSSSAFASNTRTQVYSFAVGNTAYFKALSTFVAVSSKSVTVSNAASEIATATVTNFIKDEDSIIAATQKSGLYTINPTDLKATPIPF